MGNAYFKDKCCAFIGRLQRCSREEACDKVMFSGGAPHSGVNYLTDYVIAGHGAESTKLYKKAQELQDKGMLAILTEDQFFDVLENGAEPPAVKIPRDDIVVIPAREPEPPNPYLRDKRLGYLANKRFKTPEGEMKIDLRPLYRVADAMGISDEKTDQKNK